MNNCGFVSWLDGEWPETLKNALTRLWGMYHSSNSGRIDDKIEHAKFVEELSEEKNKLERKYYTLLADVKKFTKETEKRVMEQNGHRIMVSAEEEVEVLKKEVGVLKQNYHRIKVSAEEELEVLKKEVGVLKKVQKTQAEIMKARQKEWDDEREAMKEEKRKLEYMLYDMIKVSDANKDKFKRIKQICDE